MGPTHEGSLAERKRLLEIDESAFVGGLAVLTTVLETVTDQFLRALESSEGFAETDKPMHDSAHAVRTQILRLKERVGIRRAEVRMGEPEEREERQEADEVEALDEVDAGGPVKPVEAELSAFVQQAANPKTPPNYLTMLATHPSEAVRRAVARNPLSPRRALKTLALDPDVGVRLEVAGNLSTSCDDVILLTHDSSVVVRRCANLKLDSRFGIRHA